MEFCIPKIWTNQPAFIVGGGSSIRDLDLTPLREVGRVFAVNNAAIVPGRATWSDVFYFSDRRWMDWNAYRFTLHTGEWKISRQRHELFHHVDFLSRRWSKWPNAVGGLCGGSQALNAAFHFGCNPIVLVGFDMKEQPVMNWHNEHMMPHEPNQHQNNFVPIFEMFAPILAEQRIDVINSNPESGLRCFRFEPLHAIIEKLNPLAR